MPVLFGVFLYMGVASLKGLQFFDRLLIMLMPAKYQPDYMFLRQVPIKRVHLFTIIQLACLVCLWLIKSFSATSILFPLMLVVMIGIRKALDLVFTRRELKILDDIMPEMTKRQAADDLHQLDAEVGCFRKMLPCFGGSRTSHSINEKSPAKKNGSKLNMKTASFTQANEKELEAQSALLKNNQPPQNNITAETKESNKVLCFTDHHQHQHQQQHHHHHHDRYDKYNSSINPGPTTIHIPLKVDSSETSSTSAHQQQQQQQAKSTNVPQEVQSIWQQLHEDGSSTEQLIIPINFKVRQVNGSH
uniref:Bicarbonate transporter-like transmembrane domain-containing protein n=1 Tax=Musca domestica TaxID=7370 RepID=A0A1I8M587_MUSDO